jgi:hypothetical protein
VSLADGQTGEDALSTIGVSKGQEGCLRSPSPRSPRGTEEQGMTGDANGDQETWPNLEISRNSQISRLFQNSAPRRLGVKRSRVQIPAVRLAGRMRITPVGILEYNHEQWLTAAMADVKWPRSGGSASTG